ncbi:MAG TPA: DUF6489 family protein [Alphaproteobacteria bacterium]|nr:DUF6489 family protein [Alphaproteobacteria bacterium]
MRFTVNIDCTPEEARQVLGLPDPAALQQMWLQMMQQQFMQGVQVFTQFQNAFWTGAMKALPPQK